MPRWAYCCIKHTNKGLFIYFFDPYNGFNYQQLHQDPTRQDDTYQTTLLNTVAQLGADSWELVNVLPLDGFYEHWYFKKPVP